MRHWPWEAVTALSEVVAEAGDLDTARILAGWTETVISSITASGWQAKELPSRQARWLAALAKSTAAAGNLDRARVIAGRAEAMVHNIDDQDWPVEKQSWGESEYRTVLDVDRKVDTLAAVAEAMAATGDPDRARPFASQAATDLASWITESKPASTDTHDPRISDRRGRGPDSSQSSRRLHHRTVLAGAGPHSPCGRGHIGGTSGPGPKPRRPGPSTS